MLEIDKVFKEQNSIYKEIFSIISYRKQNPLVKSDKNTRILNNIQYCERHHIIPKSWYKLHSLEINNTEENIINLSAKEHLQIHILLYKYFESIGDTKMYSRMLFALNRMIREKSITRKNINFLSQHEQMYLENEYESFRVKFVNIKLGRRTPEDTIIKWDKDYVIKINKDYLQSGFDWNFIKNKYKINVGRKRMYRIFAFYKLKYSRRKRTHKYDRELYDIISSDYMKYGFKYVKEKYELTYRSSNLFRIFKSLGIQYKKCVNGYIKYNYDIVVKMRDEYNINGVNGVKEKFGYTSSVYDLRKIFRRNNLSYKGMRK